MELSFFDNYLPSAVITAALLVILMVNLTVMLVEILEEKIEAKKGKQIKFFDHKKIWLNALWSVIFTAALVIAGFIELKASFYYCLAIMGLSTFFYETIMKKFNDKDD